MEINEFLEKTFSTDAVHIRPRVVCKDGFSISIQASDFHYCSPRRNIRTGYVEVELGYPSEVEELIIDYAEDTDYKNTVYGYVPVELVDKMLRKHGGIR